MHHELRLSLEAIAIYVAEVVAPILWEYHRHIETVSVLMPFLMAFTNELITDGALQTVLLGDGIHQIPRCRSTGIFRQKSVRNDQVECGLCSGSLVCRRCGSYDLELDMAFSRCLTFFASPFMSTGNSWPTGIRCLTFARCSDREHQAMEA